MTAHRHESASSDALSAFLQPLTWLTSVGPLTQRDSSWERLTRWLRSPVLVGCGPVTSPWDQEFDPSAGARSTLQWAHEHGASTLGEAYDLLDQLEVSNDVPEVLGHDGTVEGVREELELGIGLIGADASLTTLL